MTLVGSPAPREDLGATQEWPFDAGWFPYGDGCLAGPAFARSQQREWMRKVANPRGIANPTARQQLPYRRQSKVPMLPALLAPGRFH